MSERTESALVSLDEIWHTEPVTARRRGGGRAGLIAFLVVVGVVLLGGGGYSAWALTAPVASPVLEVAAPAVPVGSVAALTMPAEGATVVRVRGGEEYLGPDAAGVWARAGDDTARPIASVTRLVTALVVLDAVPLSGPDDAGPTLTFDAADEDLYDKYYVMGSTIAPMPVNSSLSLRDALTAMLVPSASNYAEAVSNWAFGSTGAFADAAAKWLDRHGLTATTIVEPTGNSSRNVATPSDLLQLADIAAADPVVSAILAQPSVRLPGAGTLTNTNRLLGRSGITGLKTGNLGPGTFTLVYSATLDVGIGSPLQVTGVTTGAQSRDSLDAAVVALLDSISGGFHHVPLSEAGRALGTLTTPWGSRAEVVAMGNASILTWSDTPVEVVLETSDPRTYTDGEVIGTLTWTAGPRTATSGVAVSGDIEPPTAWWRLTHPGELVGP